MPASPSIVIADDDPSVRSIITSMVAAIVPAAKITVVADGTAALAALAQQTPDLLITDYHMPVVDGLSVVRTVRAQQASYPILVISGSDEARGTVIAAGATDYLVKPIKLAVLRQCIKGLLSLPK